MSKPKAIIVSGYFNTIHKGHLEYFNNPKAFTFAVADRTVCKTIESIAFKFGLVNKIQSSSWLLKKL